MPDYQDRLGKIQEISTGSLERETYSTMHWTT